jgi:iodotyrosine deiodinase
MYAILIHVNFILFMKKIINDFPHVRYNTEGVSEEEVIKRSALFYHKMDNRRTVRDFSDMPVPKTVIKNLIMTAASAPSGAHKQPWTFCAISNPELKKEIRKAAEKEEYDSYNGRMTEQWLKDLAPIGTNWEKPFLEIAPWLIVVFAQSTGLNKEKHYYVQESVGIACGFLIAAIQEAGLVTLTHTPSPMNFLTHILDRPANERPYLLLPVGYPATEVYVPDIERKKLGEVSYFHE